MNSLCLQAGLLVFLGNVLLSDQTAQDTKLSIIYKWTALDTKIEYPNEQAKMDAIERGEYIPRNVLLVCADYHGKFGEIIERTARLLRKREWLVNTITRFFCASSYR